MPEQSVLPQAADDPQQINALCAAQGFPPYSYAFSSVGLPAIYFGTLTIYSRCAKLSGYLSFLILYFFKITRRTQDTGRRPASKKRFRG